MAGEKLEKKIVREFLQDIVPRIVERGGDERVLLTVLEHLIVGTLHVTREVFRTDPQRAFEAVRKQVDQRLADMEGEAKRSKLVLPN